MKRPNTSRKKKQRTQKAPGDTPATRLFDQAFNHHRAGRFAEAEGLYRKIYESDPTQRNVVHLLGLVSYQLGKLETAIEMLELAIDLDPRHADANNDLGNLLQEAGFLDRAEQAYRQAINIDPRHAKAYNNIGIVLKEKGHHLEAIDAYRHALEYNPNDCHTYYNLGNALKTIDDLDGAIQALGRAIELGPDTEDAHRLYCNVLRKAGRWDDLEIAFNQWLERDPDNAVALHMRAAVMGENVPARASDAYVRSVFDSFASHFDEDLENLDYEVPRRIGTAVAKVIPSDLRNGIVLDAGCGTGLCGVHLRPIVSRLEGVDLSPRMVEKAKERAIYDRLEVAELTAFMNDQVGTYHVIVAGDTFNYFGNLHPLFDSAYSALRAKGCLIFTLERNQKMSDEPDFQLQLNGRYNHSAAYAKQCLLAADFKVETCNTIVLRQQAEQDVQGFLLLATKR